MLLTTRNCLAAIALTILSAAPAKAAEDVLRIGVLADMSGIYSDMTGAGSVRAVELAVQDFGGSINGKKIEIVQGDHQNKPDIASALVRRWFDSEGVDVVVDAAGSAVALAVVEIAKTYNKSALITGAISDRLTNDACSPNHVHYGLNSHALVNGTVKALIDQGKKTWFFLVADYAFGHSLLAEATKFIELNGGKVIGSVKHPLNTSDFSSFLLQAQASKAQVIGLANASTDMSNAIAQAGEFGLQKGGQDLAAMLIFLTDVNAMGLDRAQNTVLTTASYWDKDDGSRAFAERYFQTIKRMPTFYQQADYSATLAYLQAAKSVGWRDGRATITAMKDKPINDFFARGGAIRQDGLLVHDVYLARVKSPGESKKPWDYYDIVSTVPGAQAFGSMADSKCPLIKK